MPMLLPDRQRRFALDVVRKIRAAGFEAYWAGGCVRDQLLDRVPKDYDVATSATPPEIREIFGRRRTLAIGAAFGVITVLGPPGAGQIEVATFRRDAGYSDGRHPDSVTYSTAEEDASRRDFTINGLFFDPEKRRVIDFVGGRKDLRDRVIRAIGDPQKRFGEDKLRMLRAVRFAVTLDFALDAETLATIRKMAAELTVVSQERITAEIRQMLVLPGRVAAIGLLLETGLAETVLPEMIVKDDQQRRRLDHALLVLDRFSGPSFPLALAALLQELVDRPGAVDVCRRWRLPNKETARVDWLLAHYRRLVGAQTMRWSALQKIVISPGIEELLAWEEALAEVDAGDSGDGGNVRYCRRLLQQPPEVLDPPPLVDGNDMAGHGIPPGPVYRKLLDRVRDGQLDDEIHNKVEALELVDRLMKEGLIIERRSSEGE